MKSWPDALRQSIVRKLTRIACPVRHVPARGHSREDRVVVLRKLSTLVCPVGHFKPSGYSRDERMIEVGHVCLGCFKGDFFNGYINLYQCRLCGVRAFGVLRLQAINDGQAAILDAWREYKLSTPDFVKAAQAADMTVFIKEVPHG